MREEGEERDGACGWREGVGSGLVFGVWGSRGVSHERGTPVAPFRASSSLPSRLELSDTQFYQSIRRLLKRATPPLATLIVLPWVRDTRHLRANRVYL